MFENGIRYFILDADRIKLDKIFYRNGIVLMQETIPTSVIETEAMMYLKLAEYLAGIMIL
jgi:hypothetical protein